MGSFGDLIFLMNFEKGLVFGVVEFRIWFLFFEFKNIGKNYLYYFYR